MLVVYNVKGKELGLEFIFKYDLNGDLIEFKKNQALDEAQRLWLYSSRFPETEALMKLWITDLRKKFVVTKMPADLSFDNLWNLYNLKVSKADAEKSFKKLNEADVIKCFLGLKAYEDYLLKSKIAKAHLSRYINGRYFENEY